MWGVCVGNIPRPPALETAMVRDRPEMVRIGAAIMSGVLALQKGNMEVRRAVSGDIAVYCMY